MATGMVENLTETTTTTTTTTRERERERERESMGVKGGQFVFKSRSQYRIHSLGLFLFVRVEL